MQSEINKIGEIPLFTYDVFAWKDGLCYKNTEAMGTPTTRGLINLIAGRGRMHLEVGVYRGASLVSAAHNNPQTNCIGVDNFKFFNEFNNNEQVARERISSYSNACIITDDCWDFLERYQTNNIRLDSCYYDGPHSYEDQFNALNIISGLINVGGYIIVDDINREHVDLANLHFQEKHPEFEVVLRKYAPSTDNRHHIWWNGMQVFRKIYEI